MPDALPVVLAAKDDFDLCNGLFSLLIAHHGEAFNPPSIPVEHRTVLLVWLTNSVIASRGFNGFFANRMLVDHDYRHTQAAYEALDCESAATAIRKVFDAFPDRIPPEDGRERVQLFGKANHAVNGALNRDFINTRDELTAALANYIRATPTGLPGWTKKASTRPEQFPPRPRRRYRSTRPKTRPTSALGHGRLSRPLRPPGAAALGRGMAGGAARIPRCD